MKNKKKVLWIIGLILFSNWPAFKNTVGLNNGYYKYSNESGTYTALETPIQNRMYQKPPGGKWIVNPNNCSTNTPAGDTILYRVFAINPLKFWRWGEYLFDRRYSLPYEDWNVVEKRRGFGPLKVHTNCMAF